MDTHLLQVLGIVFLCSAFTEGQLNTQENADEMAHSLAVSWDVITNTQEVMTYQVEVTLKNWGKTLTLSSGPWQIFFDSIFMIEPDLLGIRGNKGAELPGQDVRVTHVQGSLFYFEPTQNFAALPPGGMRKIKFKVRYWSVARTDSMPNWYLVVTSPQLQPVLITSTSGERLEFVSGRTSPQQWKRFNYDRYNPWSTQERYDRFFIPSYVGNSDLRVIPKPLKLTVPSGSNPSSVGFDANWNIHYADPQLKPEADYLGENIGVGAGRRLAADPGGTHVIVLRLGAVNISDETLAMSEEAYTLDVDGAAQRVTITGRGPAGVFYGANTLMGLIAQGDSPSIPVCSIEDSPRFEYRGLMLDISRNFKTDDEIIEVIKVMSRYKMNRLHLHLSDDEGWRIEIPALPELTELGSKRCHDLSETRCLLPQLGSGPDETTTYASGFLSGNGYKNVLREAQKHHVTVIPEIDMPGHARAAIKSMELRMNKLAALGQMQSGMETILTEPGDSSMYTTPQIFSDNAVNPCINSTYKFISIVMDQLKDYHIQANQPLKTFHFGGDEVGSGAWVNSTNCKALRDSGALPYNSPKAYFFERVSQLARSKGLNLGAWEDGLMQSGNRPFNLSLLAPGQTVQAYAWDDVWEWGTISRTYTLANSDYKVVMAHGTHFYFDHPYEPDPEERGYYWATRYTDTKKAFMYSAARFYDNIAERRSGQPVTEGEKCGQDIQKNCPQLKDPENILGMEATAFSETTRTQEQLHDRLFPRLLAVAERAWHKASWESMPPSTARDTARDVDWADFARSLGERELPRLSEIGVQYRLPPPGAKQVYRQVVALTPFPGLPIQYSMDGGDVWHDYDQAITLDKYRYRIWFRTRSPDSSRYSRTVVFHPTDSLHITTQPTIDYLGKNLQVHYVVKDNFEKYDDNFFEAVVTLKNSGKENITAGNWRIYFTYIQVIEPDFIKSGHEYVDPDTHMSIAHEKGYMFSLGPAPGFPGLLEGEELEIVLKADAWSVSKYEQMPNWYVAAPGMEPTTIQTTAGESLSFVGPFTEPRQYKRTKDDLFSPWSPATRYDRNQNWNVDPLPSVPLIPLPVIYRVRGNNPVRLMGVNVSVVYTEPELQSVAEYFVKTMEQLFPDIQLTVTQETQEENFVLLKTSSNLTQISDSPEAYKIHVDGSQQSVMVTGASGPGVFYGVISLIHLAAKNAEKGTVAECHIEDWPRFPYRGMHTDTARNFIPKCGIMNLLEVMALYKLNKFHFHLTDDEAWRLEIPGLPELTEIGGKRCHDPKETECIMSTLGSGPDDSTSGSGFYTRDEYREILRFAAERNIEVIPEVDTPGHAHSAIRAMMARHQKLMDLGRPSEASQYDLVEAGDLSRYFSVQFYTDNAVNPCMESTYAFIEKVVSELKKMHQDIQPLKVFHFGGDEVAHGAWVNSTACRHHVARKENLKREFTRRVSDVTKDLTLGAWEDGLMDYASAPWNRSILSNSEVIAQAWQNVWEWGAGARAYNLANNGYKVVLAPVTHLYFDHPQEPNPYERGFYWGTRYTDTFKSFSFMPDDYYMNADIQRSGEKITMEEICGEDNKGCPPLEKPENIIGIQGQLWSETVRQTSQFQYMVFPRLLALAERAWHKADWEGKDKAARQAGLFADWARFSRELGSRDLDLLEMLDVEYRMPPPGAKQRENKIVANVEFPGLGVQYQIKGTGSLQWRDLDPDKTFTAGQKVALRTKNLLGTRFSEEVVLNIRKYVVVNDGNQAALVKMSPVVWVVLLLSVCMHIVRVHV
ncbi:uncharacterized protein LOC101851597 [Aplysia californica]|uniref:beta-N-acetylhexosaminidase n=1 Tax=Aplysia californica TaxID=6500 RepID=A0ABM1A6X0_APLCA|nr:uncharacterized protein LOC101851597 [Aplysia californica]